MGMNMVSKGAEKVIESLSVRFPYMKLIALSGNACSDKKNAAIYWVNGRGKSVTAEAVLTEQVVQQVLGTTIDDIVVVCRNKNLIGSAVAGYLYSIRA